jgi:hypothetical protein
MRLHFPQVFTLPHDNKRLLLALSQHHCCIRQTNSSDAARKPDCLSKKDTWLCDKKVRYHSLLVQQTKAA